MSDPEAIAIQPVMQLEAPQANWALNLKRLAVGAGTVAMSLMGMEGSSAAGDASHIATSNQHHSTETPHAVERLVLRSIGQEGPVMDPYSIALTGSKAYFQGHCSKTNPAAPVYKVLHDVTTRKLVEIYCDGRTQIIHRTSLPNYTSGLDRAANKVAELVGLTKSDHGKAKDIHATNKRATIDFMDPVAGAKTTTIKPVKSIVIRLHHKPVVSRYTK